MCKKKLMTAILVTTMVMGSTLTAFAADAGGDAASKSGGTSGSGTSEGHLEKVVESMILPVVPADSSPFAYTMDPERLIQETSGKKYPEGSVFPAADSDTGVYFQTADKTYANTSNTLKAINDGSCDVTLTVKVKTTASAGGKDITLAASSTPAATGTPELYLGLAVGKGTPSVVSGTEATITKTIAGTPGNFEVTVDENNKYVYQKKADATTWKAIDISMTGAVSKLAIPEGTTAPTVDVTWAYAKAADGATVDASDQVEYKDVPDVAPSIEVKQYNYDRTTTFDIVTDFGSGDSAATSITSVKSGSSETEVNDDQTSACTINGNTITFPAGKFPAPAVGTKKYIKVTFDNDVSVVVELTITK